MIGKFAKKLEEGAVTKNQTTIASRGSWDGYLRPGKGPQDFHFLTSGQSIASGRPKGEGKRILSSNGSVGFRRQLRKSSAGKRLTHYLSRRPLQEGKNDAITTTMRGGEKPKELCREEKRKVATARRATQKTGKMGVLGGVENVKKTISSEVRTSLRKSWTLAVHRGVRVKGKEEVNDQSRRNGRQKTKKKPVRVGLLVYGDIRIAASRHKVRQGET